MIRQRRAFTLAAARCKRGQNARFALFARSPSQRERFHAAAEFWARIVGHMEAQLLLPGLADNVRAEAGASPRCTELPGKPGKRGRLRPA